MTMNDEPLILGSALKRPGIGESDILHALAHVIRAFPEVNERGPYEMHVGPALNASLIEVGLREKYGLLTVFHAMPARRKYTEMLGW